MGMSLRKNIGAYLRAAYAAVATALTAAGSGDNTAVTGVTVDRFAAGSPLSCSVLYAIAATIANTKTLSLAYKVQHGAKSDASDMADYAVVANGVVMNGKSDGSAQTGLVKHDVDLNGALQYIRIVFTPDLSATSADTATVAPVFVFGGMAELP